MYRVYRSDVYDNGPLEFEFTTDPTGTNSEGRFDVRRLPTYNPPSAPSDAAGPREWDMFFRIMRPGATRAAVVAAIELGVIVDRSPPLPVGVAP